MPAAGSRCPLWPPSGLGPRLRPRPRPRRAAGEGALAPGSWGVLSRAQAWLGASEGWEVVADTRRGRPGATQPVLILGTFFPRLESGQGPSIHPEGGCDKAAVAPNPGPPPGPSQLVTLGPFPDTWPARAPHQCFIPMRLVLTLLLWWGTRPRVVPLCPHGHPSLGTPCPGCWTHLDTFKNPGGPSTTVRSGSLGVGPCIKLPR